MKAWSKTFVDDKYLLNLVFNKSDYSIEDIRGIVDIIKAYYKEEAKILQLIGFRVNDYTTKNPLVVVKNILTPIYDVLFNLNKISFHTSYSNLSLEHFESIDIPITGFGLTYGQLREILLTKDIAISYTDVNDTDYIIKCINEDSMNKLTIFLTLVDKNSTEDYIKHLMSENGNAFIFSGLLKKFDYNIIYNEESIVVKFNLPIYDSKHFLDNLSKQILELSQYV